MPSPTLLIGRADRLHPAFVLPWVEKWRELFEIHMLPLLWWTDEMCCFRSPVRFPIYFGLNVRFEYIAVIFHPQIENAEPWPGLFLLMPKAGVN